MVFMLVLQFYSSNFKIKYLFKSSSVLVPVKNKLPVQVKNKLPVTAPYTCIYICTVKLD